MTYRDPPQGLLDYLSRKDELQVRTNQLLEKVLAALTSNSSNPPSAIPTQQLQSLKSQLESGQYTPYNVRTFSMDTAGTDVEFVANGSNLLAVSDGSLNGVTVKFNNTRNDPLPLAYFIGKAIPFSRIYLSWSAQPAKNLYVVIGQGDTEFTLTGYGVTGGATGKQTLLNSAFGSLPAGTYYTSWLNLVAGQRAVIFVTNTLDQPVTIQAIGNITDVLLPGSGFVYKGLSKTVIAVTGIGEIGISDVYWDPYIALEITQPGVVTVGSLLVEAVVQG